MTPHAPEQCKPVVSTAVVGANAGASAAPPRRRCPHGNGFRAWHGACWGSGEAARSRGHVV